MGEVLLKVHESYRTVVAVCDKELYGKRFVEGKKVLDLTGEFFNGDLTGKLEAKELIEDFSQEDASFNIVGKDSVEIFKELRLVKDCGVLEVSGIPFALVLL